MQLVPLHVKGINQFLIGRVMHWKDFMYFTTSERNGVKVMLVLLFIVLFAPTISQWLFPPREKGLASFEKEIVEFERKMGNTSSPSSEEAASTSLSDAKRNTEKVITIQPFNFNPNNLPESSWEEMGLPGYLIRTIKNYEKAGGSFRFREDLLRIYLMKAEWYEVLEPYIELPSKESTARSRTQDMDTGTQKKITPIAEETVDESLTLADVTASPDASEKTNLPLFIDINKADTLELKQLKGIGSVFSRRIIAYRKLLGGYLNAEQLLEVYGMDSTRLDPIRESLNFDQGGIDRINLNEADFVTLVRHPYIDRNLANALLSYIDQHKPLDSLGQLRRSHLITDEIFERISPYLILK